MSTTGTTNSTATTRAIGAAISAPMALRRRVCREMYGAVISVLRQRSGDLVVVAPQRVRRAEQRVGHREHPRAVGVVERLAEVDRVRRLPHPRQRRERD